MRVVRVKQRDAPPDLAQEGQENARVETGPPLDLVHPDMVPLEPDGQLGVRAGHDYLIGETGLPELSREKPHLTLPATPLTAGRDVDDGGDHVSGSASTGRLSRRRT
jgi:hypothetical protein